MGRKAFHPIGASADRDMFAHVLYDEELEASLPYSGGEQQRDKIVAAVLNLRSAGSSDV